ncbi:SAV_2336 N-terminal domain-related protein [Kitasatospora sp. NPDC058201]|uniref:SAV_2336 N-terminal domain-related protein n=1 Tax=unclassified Kitasatospora TaxID=2633591 RepID=UPI00364CE816
MSELPPPPRGLRDALAHLLRSQEGDPLPQDLADVLWISRLAGLDPLAAGADPAPRPAPSAPVRPEPPAGEPSTGRPADPPAGPPDRPDPRSGPTAALHPLGSAGAAGTPGTGGGHVVRVPQPAALSGGLALARALRPLRRPVDGTGRAVLDEEATAEVTAETGVLLPVWTAAQRPYFSVDLLVDTGATMAVWHGLARELGTLLERHGAFADVRCWALDTNRPDPVLTPFRRRRPGPGRTAPAPARNWSRPLRDPTDRRILFVLTDGVGPAWYGDGLPAFLARTSAGRPVAVLQVLPRRLWHRTALRTAPVEARASVAGRPVPVFRSDAALPGIPRGAGGATARAGVRWLPVLEVDADWLAPWAELTAGRSSGWTPMLAAPLGGVPRPRRPVRARDEEVTAAERVARFRAGGSPTAYRLACHLAAAPLSLPVMRLVQRAAVPESGQTDLAEIFVSGLIEPYDGVIDREAEPDDQVYDFRAGVRDLLLTELTRGESVRILEQVVAKVSGRIAATFGGVLDFRALAAAGEPDGTGLRLPARSLPFAEVAVAVLAGAGGQHVALARTLATALQRTPRDGAIPAPRREPSLLLRRDRLNPVRPVVTPPDPPTMIGRTSPLAAVARAFGTAGAGEAVRPASAPDRPALVVVVGRRGTGRRRLAQEYVRRHGDRHSFTHWIDAVRSDTAEQGREQLWAALSDEPSDRRLGTLWEALGRHRDWLLVLDGVPESAWTRPDPDSGVSPLPLLVPSTGRGCVLVTTDAIGRWHHPDATVVTLEDLTDEEILDELHARWRAARGTPTPSQAARIEHLAQRLPRLPDTLAGYDIDAELAAVAAFRDHRTAPPDEHTGPDEPSGPPTVEDRAATVRLPPADSPLLSALPPRSPVFVGRDKELTHLLDLLTPPPPGDLPARRVALVAGLPGVGKSELVLQAAGTVRDRGWFPGGVLHLDLGGNRTDPGTIPEQALDTLLRALGVSARHIPAGLPERTRLYRSLLNLLADGRGPLLLVLDNATGSRQVEPLLPADGSHAVLVTSRRSLVIDARRHDLGPLSPTASVALLHARIRNARGPADTRVQSETGPALNLARLCGGLPLALSACARILAATPSRSLRSLAADLSDQGLGLAGFETVRAAFDQSYTELSDPQARLFRLLSVHPGPELSTTAVARLADTSERTADRLVANLAEVHLVQPGAGWGRWRFHDLIRLYSLQQGEAHAGADDRDDALARLLAYYRTTAGAAATHLDGRTAAPSPRFTGSEQARAWLEAERENLVGLTVAAPGSGDPDVTLRLAPSLTGFLVLGRYFDDLAAVVDAVVGIQRRRGDHEALDALSNRLANDLRTALQTDTVDYRANPGYDRVVRLISSISSVADRVRTKVPGTEVRGRLYLSVPFDEKDEAQKEVGARWDQSARLWWTVPENRLRAARWLPPTAGSAPRAGGAPDLTPLGLAVELKMYRPSGESRTDFARAERTVRELLLDIIDAASIEGSVEQPRSSFGADLLVTLAATADPVAAAGLVIAGLASGLDRMQLALTEPWPHLVGVTVFSGPAPARAPGAEAMRAQLVEADHSRTSDPLAVLSVSGPVLELIRERLGGQWSTGFTEVPPAGADPRTGGTTHTFTGSTLLLGRALAGSAGGDRPGPW